MIDCTKTTNYFSEKKRMGRQASGVCKLRCTDCPYCGAKMDKE